MGSIGIAEIGVGVGDCALKKRAQRNKENGSSFRKKDSPFVMSGISVQRQSLRTGELGWKV
jgi:hypothetical protein